MSTKREIHKLKIYTINKLRQIEQLAKEKQHPKSWLTVKEIQEQFDISRKTFDRLREKGLKVSQVKRNGKILVERNEIINLLKR